MSAYRDDVEALNARHTALSNELTAKTRELADATRLLDDARARAKLPVLDNIRVATPCAASWASMSGDERVRACADCNKHVYNISNLTRDEAHALILEKEGKLCVRFFQRADGTILLKDCTIGIAQKRKRRLVAAGAAALLAGGAGAMLYRSHVKANEPQPIKMERVTFPDEQTHPSQTQVHETAPPPEYREVLGDFSY